MEAHICVENAREVTHLILTEAHLPHRGMCEVLVGSIVGKAVGGTASLDWLDGVPVLRTRIECGEVPTDREELVLRYHQGKVHTDLIRGLVGAENGYSQRTREGFCIEELKLDPRLSRLG